MGVPFSSSKLDALCIQTVHPATRPLQRVELPLRESLPYEVTEATRPPGADIQGFGPSFKVLGIGSNHQQACRPFAVINVGLVLEQTAPHPLHTAGAADSVFVRVGIRPPLHTGQETPARDATVRLQFTETTPTWGRGINIPELKPDCEFCF